jgi:hypothetical protein
MLPRQSALFNFLIKGLNYLLNMNTEYFGVYSKKAEKKLGSQYWKGVDGKKYRVTATYSSIEGIDLYPYEDKVYTPVQLVKFLSAHKPRRLGYSSPPYPSEVS